MKGPIKHFTGWIQPWVCDNPVVTVNGSEEAPEACVYAQLCVFPELCHPLPTPPPGILRSLRAQKSAVKVCLPPSTTLYLPFS